MQVEQGLGGAKETRQSLQEERGRAGKEGESEGNTPFEAVVISFIHMRLKSNDCVSLLFQLTPWNVDTLSQPGFEKTVSCLCRSFV